MAFELGPHDALTQVSSDWDFSVDKNAEDLEKQMIDFMLDNNGIGLAANQIGFTKNVFVIGSKNISGYEPMAVFNPKILEVSKDTELFKEGCLSYPDLWLTIKRPKAIIAEFQNSKGDIVTAEMDGLIARCFQHEFDHLKGICFVDRVSQMKLQLAIKKINKRK
jgi:peptide deformylase